MERMRKPPARDIFDIFAAVFAVIEEESKKGGFMRIFGREWQEELGCCVRKKQKGESVLSC